MCIAIFTKESAVYRSQCFKNVWGKLVTRCVCVDHKGLTLELPDQICHSSYCRSYNSYNVSSENLVLDQLIIPKLIFFFIPITYLVDIVLIL